VDWQVQYEVGRRPKLPWPLVAIHFGLPFQCWKRLQHCPVTVYGILVQTLLGFWWIFNSNMRLGGDLKKPAAVHFGRPSQHWKQPSTPPMLVYSVLVQHFGVFVAYTLNMVRRGHKKDWPPMAIHLCLSSQCCKWPSTLLTLVYGVLVQVLLDESGFKFVYE